MDAIANLSTCLLDLPVANGETIIANGGQLMPRPGSTAQREIDGQAQFLGRSEHPVLDTYSRVHVRLLGSMQNLVGIGRLLQTGPIEPTCGVLGRASLESAAAAWWLLGEEGDARVRVARGRAQLFYELHQDARILRGVSNDLEGEQLVAEISSTIEEIAADCEAIGIEVSRSARGDVTLPEAAVPFASTAVKDLLGDEGLIAYRVLCGSTHGSSHTAVRSMTGAPVDSGTEGVTVMMPANDPMAIVPTLGVVIQAYYRANDRRFAALGWDVRPWAEWKLRTMSTVVQLIRDGAA